MDKRKLYRYTSRLYAELRNDPDIVLKKLRQMHGYYDGETIVLDYRKELISTLIHEFLHKWYPEWSETKVLNEESAILNALSTKQVCNIMYAFGNYLRFHT